MHARERKWAAAQGKDGVVADLTSRQYSRARTQIPLRMHLSIDNTTGLILAVHLAQSEEPQSPLRGKKRIGGKKGVPEWYR